MKIEITYKGITYPVRLKYISNDKNVPRKRISIKGTDLSILYYESYPGVVLDPIAEKIVDYNGKDKFILTRGKPEKAKFPLY